MYFFTGIIQYIRIRYFYISISAEEAGWCIGVEEGSLQLSTVRGERCAPQFCHFLLSCCNFCHSSSFLGFRSFAAQAFSLTFHNFGAQAFSSALQFLPILFELLSRLSQFCRTSIFLQFPQLWRSSFFLSFVIFATRALSPALAVLPRKHFSSAFAIFAT